MKTKHCGTCRRPLDKETLDFINSNYEDGICATCLLHMHRIHQGKVISVTGRDGVRQDAKVTHIKELLPGGVFATIKYTNGKEADVALTRMLKKRG